MIITLKGADFSSNKIGVLSSWTIFTTLGTGATYSGSKLVDKNGSLSATVTIADGYELGSAGVSVIMGTTDISSGAAIVNGNTITISIATVTGNVTIKVPTLNTSTGEESGGGEDTPIETTTWYINDATQLSNNGVDLSAGSGLGITVGAFSYKAEQNNLLVGKQINTVQLRVHTAGKFTFYRYNSSTKTMTEIQSFTLENPDATTLQTYKFTTPFTLAEGEFLAFGSTTDTGKSYYYYNIDFKGSDTYTCYYRISNGATQENLGSTISFGMNIGYIG